MGTQAYSAKDTARSGKGNLLRVDIALDGTDHSQIVVDNLHRFIKPEHASADFLYVLPCPPTLDRRFRDFDQEAKEEVARIMNKHFDDYSQTLSEHHFIVDRRHFVECYDNVEEGIYDQIRRNKPELLVVGMHQTNVKPRKGWHISSTGYAVATHAECSVLVIKNPPKQQNRLNVLFATDGSDYAARALAKMMRFLPQETSDIKILSVIPVNYYILPVVEPYVDYAPLEKALKGDATKLLESTREQLAGQGYHVSNSYFVLGDPIEQILQEAKKSECDLIVLGSHGLGGRISQWLLGSVSTKVLQYASQSVAILK